MAFSFDNLPINPLVGADSATFDRVTSGVEIDHLARFRATKICQRVLNPLYQVNNRIYDRANLQKIVSPLFILGHWRSGTTLLHNLLAEDAQFCYCTTYQTIFPHLMIRGSSVMRHLAALAMPHSRPKDHQILSISQPQEEEFAIANTTTSAYYHFWIFPRLMPYYRTRFLSFEGASNAELEEFCSALRRVMQVTLYCSGKSRFLSKNPPNTARIPILLRLFPDAKFVYIHRNKSDVLRSTKEFVRHTTNAIALQKVSPEWLDNEVEKTYNELISRYNRDKYLIPQGSLCEISFAELTTQGKSTINRIYSCLGLKRQ